MQQSFFVELLKRLKSENPRWSKIMSRIGLVIFLIASGLKFLISKAILHVEPTILKMGIVTINFDLDSILTGVLGGGIGMLFLSQTGTTDPDLQDDKTVKNLFQKRM